LIFKEQANVIEPGLREKGLAQPHYSIQHIEGYDLLVTQITNKIYIHQALRQRIIRDRQEQKRKYYQEYYEMAKSYTRF
jgi:hypothetical protein